MIRARLAGMIALCIVMFLLSVSISAFRLIEGKHARLPGYVGLAFITLLPVATFGSYKIRQWSGYRMIREAERYREEYGTAKSDLAEAESHNYPKSAGWLDCIRLVTADLASRSKR